jgi:flagellar basal-body rod protein FlgF
MDRLLYTSMSGINRVLDAQAENAGNIANSSTTAFKAALSASVERPVGGAGMPTRVSVASQSGGADLSEGSLVSTGNRLDVAIRGSGWMVVQSPDGGEALSRRGDLEIDVNGLLRTGAGDPVLGDGGPIAVPPSRSVTIGDDGTISVVPLGQGPEAPAVVDRIRLVDPDAETLRRGTDGLFRTQDGQTPPADAEVRLLSGHLEGSNVNLADAMVEMISLSRQFEMQVRMMRIASDNADSASRLMRMQG